MQGTHNLRDWCTEVLRLTDPDRLNQMNAQQARTTINRALWIVNTIHQQISNTLSNWNGGHRMTLHFHDDDTSHFGRMESASNCLQLSINRGEKRGTECCNVLCGVRTFATHTRGLLEHLEHADFAKFPNIRVIRDKIVLGFD